MTMVLSNILVAARVTALLVFISALTWAHSSNAATILFFEANGTVGASVSGFDIQTPDVVVLNSEDVLAGDFVLGEFTSTSAGSGGGPLLAFLLEPRTGAINGVVTLFFDVSGAVGTVDGEFEFFQTPLHQPGVPGVAETGGIVDLTSAFIDLDGHPVALAEGLTIEAQLPLGVPEPGGFGVALAVAALGIAAFRTPRGCAKP